MLGAAALAAATIGRGVAGEAGSGLRLGGPIFDDYDGPDEWVRALKKLGYNSAYCPVGPDVPDDVVRAFNKMMQYKIQ